MPVPVDKGARNIAIFKTILTTAEKVLDGLPIYGPKAAIAASADVFRNIQVSKALCSLIF
jgi:hypothetical protein